MSDTQPGPVPSSLSNVMAEFDAAARHLSLGERQIAAIREPRLSLKVNFPVQLDSGKTFTVRSYHTIHSILRGPAMGGVQFRPDISQETVEALAFWATHRASLLGVPLGGSASAVVCDPSMYSVGELERLSRRLMTELSSLVRPDLDILTSNIGTNQQVMCWFMDTYSMNTGRFSPGVVLGKPGDLGGSITSSHPVAIGADLCIRKALEYLRIPIRETRTAIQGFGNVGSHVARRLHEAGSKVVAVADISGAYWNDNGIDIEKMAWHQQAYGLLDGVEGELDVERLDDPGELFALPVDILVPAAIELQITRHNMAGVKAKIIAEVAHDPVSPKADRVLQEHGTLIIPDTLCNSGGIAGNYLEWVQNRMGYYWSQERVEQEISRLVGEAFDSALRVKREEQLSLRLAAAVLAVKRLAAAAGLRGMHA